MNQAQLIRELSEALTAVTNMICPGGPPDAQGNEYFITFNDAECESRLARAAKVLAQVEEKLKLETYTCLALSMAHLTQQDAEKVTGQKGHPCEN